MKWVGFHIFGALQRNSRSCTRTTKLHLFEIAKPYFLFNLNRIEPAPHRKKPYSIIADTDVSFEIR